MAASTGKHETDLSNDIICEDFLAFQDILKKLRRTDDIIVNKLNTVVPTASFADKVDTTKECQQLYTELTKAYDDREKRIKHCIGVVSKQVNGLREQRQQNMDDIDLLKTLRKEQTKLRLMRAELSVEEVVKDRSLKVFYEKCRNHYRPPNAPNV